MRLLATLFVLRTFTSLIVFAGLAYSQQVTVTGYTEQDVITILNGISQHFARLEPMLEQVRAKTWEEKGAPETYAIQYKRVQDQIRKQQQDLATLAQHTDNLQEGMRELYKIQAFHRSLTSVMEGLRKYQNPALADLISAVAAEDQTLQDRFQYYLIQLASDKDVQYQMVDKESQRCRALLSKQPAPPPVTKPRLKN